MSGPKVVRVVTREEIVALCQRHLLRLDAAISTWERTGAKHALLSEAEIAATKRRREVIANLLTTEQFLVMQKQAGQETDFLKKDTGRIVEQAVLEAELQRSKKRRQKEGIEALIKAIEAQGKHIPEALRKGLKELDNTTAVSEAWKMLSDNEAASSDTGPSDTQKQLAAFYSEGAQRRSLADWIAAQPVAPRAPALKALDQKVAELGVLGSVAFATLETRLVNLEGLPDSRRNLLLDSLALDVNQALIEAREAREVSVDLALVLSELKVIDPTTASKIEQELSVESVQEVRLGVRALPSNALRALMVRAEQALAKAQALHTAGLRREAVLRNLSTLGYEITEGMTTAWVNNGKLVVRNATRPDYGVEIGGDLSAERAQMRVVAFVSQDAPEDRERDRDAETIWCSDVAKLNENLQKEGASLEIERALPVGATPVKRVSDPYGVEHYRSGEVGAPGRKSLERP
jgi:hypothetical protein